MRLPIATHAASEDINLQNANLRVNCDLPWNPTRLEWRFRRIPLGQIELCHLWSMAAAETCEGDVFQRLLEKLEVQRQTVGGRVFDTSGEAIEDRPLKDLLIEAIRCGSDREVRACLLKKVEGALDTQHLEAMASTRRTSPSWPSWSLTATSTRGRSPSASPSRKSPTGRCQRPLGPEGSARATTAKGSL